MEDEQIRTQVSVIVCTYNRSANIIAFLERFKYQAHFQDRHSWELIVVDNNSTDDTEAALTSYMDMGLLRFRYLRTEKHGKSYALNKAISKAKGSFLAFTDDDVVLDRFWLSSIFEASTRVDYAVFGGKVIPTFDTPLPHWLMHENRCVIDGGPLVCHDYGSVEIEHNSAMKDPIGANMFLQKRLFEKHGLSFRTDLGPSPKSQFIYGEDSELMTRLRDCGVRVLYFPKAIVYHPISQERLRKPYLRKYYWGTGRALAKIEGLSHHPVSYFGVPRYLIRQIVEQIVEFCKLFLKKSKGKTFKAELILLHYLGMAYEYYLTPK